MFLSSWHWWFGCVCCVPVWACVFLCIWRSGTAWVSFLRCCPPCFLREHVLITFYCCVKTLTKSMRLFSCKNSVFWICLTVSCRNPVLLPPFLCLLRLDGSKPETWTLVGCSRTLPAIILPLATLPNCPPAATWPRRLCFILRKRYRATGKICVFPNVEFPLLPQI